MSELRINKYLAWTSQAKGQKTQCLDIVLLASKCHKMDCICRPSWPAPYLISAILVPPLPIMQPISSFGTVISWVWVPGPVPCGARSWEPARAASAVTAAVGDRPDGQSTEVWPRRSQPIRHNTSHRDQNTDNATRNTRNGCSRPSAKLPPGGLRRLCLWPCNAGREAGWMVLT